jgi:hypothetical protein
MTTIENRQAPCLREIIAQEIDPLFRLSHLNRDVIIGLVGERGSGKSLGGANIALKDYGFSNEPIWSNMNIKVGVKVTNDEAIECGATAGGIETYASQHLDKQEFLALDGKYEGGCLFFDEFNLEYGGARRSTANVNLMTDRAVQQLRKLQCALIYTVLDEMYVDVRIRDNTDLFITCTDTAFKAQNLASKMRQGIAFEWKLWFMTSKLVGFGNTYKETHRAVGPVPVTLREMWGSINTMERQAEGQTKYSVQPKQLIRVEMEEDAKITVQKIHYAGFDERMHRFYANHASDGDTIEIAAADMANEFGTDRKHWGPWAKQLWERVPNIEITGKGNRTNPTKYKIPNKILSFT